MDEKKKDSTIVRDIFKRKDGGPVEPPEFIQTLFSDVKLAVEQFVRTTEDSEEANAFKWLLNESAKNCAAEVVSWESCPEGLFAEIKTSIERPLAGEPKTDPGMVEQWGGCPKCHENHGFLFFDSSIYMTCGTHRLSWCIGSGLFSAYEYYTEEALIADKLMLMFVYEPTEPWFSRPIEFPSSPC